jgi:hypothetical protein
MTSSTVSAAGGAMSQALTFDVKRGMYDTCNRITGRIGLAGEVFAEAYFFDLDQAWGIDIFNADGTVGDFSIDVTDREQAIDRVKALMSLEYSRNYVRRAA